MNRLIVMFVPLWLLLQPVPVQARISPLSVRVSGSGSMSVGMLGHYTYLGLGTTAGIGWRPLADSKDIELAMSISYDRFANEQQRLGSYSFVRAGVGVQLKIGAQQRNPVYLAFDIGPAFVSIKRNSGFPPFRGQSHSSTNLFGAGAIGMTFEVSQEVSMFSQIEFVDILDTLFGDYRFFRFSVGARL